MVGTTEQTEKTMSKLNLYQKIVEVRKCVPFLKKDEQGYKYKYVPGISLLSAIKDKMNELNLLLVPSVSDHTFSTEATVNSKGEAGVQRIIEAKMIMTWIDADSGERMEVPWLLFGEQNDISKAFGSGLTYSERYYLLKALNVPTDEDDPDSKGKPQGRTGNKPANETTSKPDGKLSGKQWDFIKNIGAKKDLTEPEVIKLITWVAKENKIDTKHWKISHLLLPLENFEKQLEKYLDAMGGNSSIEPPPVREYNVI